jgi:hypothetical protein
MPWEPERNIRSLSPHGIKEAEGHAARGVHDINQVGCPPMPAGILGAPLNAMPNDRGEPGRGPVKFEPSARAPNEMGPGLLRANGPLDPNPHPYTPAAQKQAPNTYGNVPVEKRR